MKLQYATNLSRKAEAWLATTSCLLCWLLLQQTEGRAGTLHGPDGVFLTSISLEEQLSTANCIFSTLENHLRHNLGPSGLSTRSIVDGTPLPSRLYQRGGGATWNEPNL